MTKTEKKWMEAIPFGVWVSYWKVRPRYVQVTSILGLIKMGYIEARYLAYPDLPEGETTIADVFPVPCLPWNRPIPGAYNPLFLRKIRDWEDENETLKRENDRLKEENERLKSLVEVM